MRSKEVSPLSRCHSCASIQNSGWLLMFVTAPSTVTCWLDAEGSMRSGDTDVTATCTVGASSARAGLIPTSARASTNRTQSVEWVRVTVPS